MKNADTLQRMIICRTNTAKWNNSFPVKFYQGKPINMKAQHGVASLLLRVWDGRLGIIFTSTAPTSRKCKFLNPIASQTVLPGQRRRDPDDVTPLPWRPVWLCILMGCLTQTPPLNYSLGPAEEQASPPSWFESSLEPDKGPTQVHLKGEKCWDWCYMILRL